MGNHQFAINDFNEALKIDPEFAEAYFRLGISQLKSRHYHDAIDNFKKSLQLEESGENPGCFDGQGSCYHMLGDFEQAIMVIPPLKNFSISTWPLRKTPITSTS